MTASSANAPASQGRIALLGAPIEVGASRRGALMGPAGLSPDVVKRLNSEIALYLTQPELRDLLSQVAATPRPGTPDEMGRVNAFEVARWSKLLKERNIKID